MSDIQSWSEVPEELLRMIAEKLNLVDLVRFSKVCHSWRSVIIDDKHHFSPLPWLMFTVDDDRTDRAFYSLFENKIYHLNLPEARGCRCWDLGIWGSSSGWLITINFCKRQLQLLNPLSRAQPLMLPFLPDPLGCISKAVVSKTVEEHELLVWIAHGKPKDGKTLAFARPGDSAWTMIDTLFIKDFYEILYFNGQVYSIVDRYLADRCLLIIRDPETYRSGGWVRLPRPEGVYISLSNCRLYLVELQGEIYLLVRVLIEYNDPELPPTEGIDGHRETISIKVYKLDLGTHEWEELQTLSEHAIFVGGSSSFSVKASECPECKPGCIYFIDDHNKPPSVILHGHDMGIFNLETKEFENLYEVNGIISRFSARFWISPNPF